MKKACFLLGFQITSFYDDLWSPTFKQTWGILVYQKVTFMIKLKSWMFQAEGMGCERPRAEEHGVFEETRVQVTWGQAWKGVKWVGKKWGWGGRQAPGYEEPCDVFILTVQEDFQKVKYYKERSDMIRSVPRQSRKPSPMVTSSTAVHPLLPCRWDPNLLSWWSHTSGQARLTPREWTVTGVRQCHSPCRFLV